MKTTCRLAIVSLLLLLAAPYATFAQAKINTKKVRIADLSTRTTKVVLAGNDMRDEALKSEVSARWRISPYEFCSAEEYNSIKESTDYYFLLFARSEEKKYKGILTLTLMKGGKYGAQDPQKRPVEVASLPFCSTEFPSGREMTMLPALIDIIQDYASKAMMSDKAGYSGFDIYSRNISKAGHKRIYFSGEDLVPGIEGPFSKAHFDEDMVIAPEEEADSVFNAGTYNTLVSYVVAPFDPINGSPCYKMLIDAQTHELYYFKLHRIKSGRWSGFLPKDIKVISSSR